MGLSESHHRYPVFDDVLASFLVFVFHDVQVCFQDKMATLAELPLLIFLRPEFLSPTTLHLDFRGLGGSAILVGLYSREFGPLTDHVLHQ